VLSSLDPTSRARYVGFIAGLLGSPIGCALALRERLPGRRAVTWIAAAVFPGLAVGAYEVTLLFPAALGTQSTIWLGFGIVAAAGVLYLSSVDEQSVVRSLVVGTAGAIWWSCWGIFMAVTVPLPSHPFGDDIKCACHMKVIAESIDLFHKPNRNSEAVLREVCTRISANLPAAACPSGKGPYIIVCSACRPKGMSDKYLLICPYHKDKLVVLTDCGRVVVFDRRLPPVIQQIRAYLVGRG